MLQKTITLLILTWIISIHGLCADNYTLSQAKFRDDIKKFLTEEGYSPSIDIKSGNINFKMEGTNYVIDLNTDYDGPYLVTLSALFNMESMSSAGKVRLFEIENTINRQYSCVKSCCFDFDDGHVLVFSVESFCHNSDDFKYALIKYLDLIKAAINEFTNLYHGNSGIGSDRSSVHSGNSSKTIGSVSSRSGSKVYLSAPILESSYHKWWANSIELNTHGTVVSKTVVPKVAETYVCSTRDEYIEDCDTGKRYYIISSTIGIQPQNTVLHTKGPKSFSDTYQALPASVKRISIWSGFDYYIKNLQIR